MWSLEELRRNKELVNKIDWEMTQEKAIEMYLEWGTGWVRGNDFVATLGQESYYFVLYDWEQPPAATLIRRTTAGAEEIAKVQVPQELFAAAVAADGYRPGVGVHSLTPELRRWLCDRLAGVSLAA
ncbi:MAG TPA: hypothetical protein ENJ73_04125 [Desulfobacterales bacterium]|nr:hypothetical protein [Desulfobacterales bacterium]